jgi:hypothetical protein
MNKEKEMCVVVAQMMIRGLFDYFFLVQRTPE